MARPRLISDEQILNAMREAALTHGPKVSLDIVAGNLGVSAPALLKRFGSRDELLVSALKPPSDPEWIQRLRQGPSDEPFEAQLLELFSSMSKFLESVVPCMMALRESGIPLETIFKGVRPPQEGIEVIASWLQGARKKDLIEAEELETAAFAILGALQTRHFFSHMLQKRYSAESERRYLEELSAFFARALGARTSTRRNPRKR